MKRLLMSLAAIALLVWGCSAGQGTARVRADVQQFVRTYGEAENKADITAMMEMFPREPGVTSITDGDITRGWDAIRTSTDELVGKEGSYKISYGSIDVIPLGGAHALVVTPCTVTALSDSASIEIHGAMTLVLEKTGGSWKIIHEHMSSKAADSKEGGD